MGGSHAAADGQGPVGVCRFRGRAVVVCGAVGLAVAYQATCLDASFHSHVRRVAPRCRSPIAGPLVQNLRRVVVFIIQRCPQRENQFELGGTGNAPAHVHCEARADASGGINFTPHASPSSGGGDRHEPGDHDGEETHHRKFLFQLPFATENFSLAPKPRHPPMRLQGTLPGWPQKLEL